jgi:hypothetical protein
MSLASEHLSDLVDTRQWFQKMEQMYAERLRDPIVRQTIEELIADAERLASVLPRPRTLQQRSA